MTESIKRRLWAWINPSLISPLGGLRSARFAAAGGVLVATLLAAPSYGSTETRTLTLVHAHTGEKVTVTYKRDGRIDEAAAAQLDNLLRDWRKNKSVRMDRRMFDVLWQVQQTLAPTTPITIICGYRSPGTNAMLRGRSSRSGVAEFSQHMLGRAIDFYVPGVPLAKVREIGFRISAGGVGFYPTSGSPFVHLDVGGVRAWPRPSRDLLAKIFPDGKTAYLPSSGGPMPRYAEAVAELKTRNVSTTPIMVAAADPVETANGGSAPAPKNFFDALFGAFRKTGPANAAQTLVASATPEKKPTFDKPTAVAQAKVPMPPVAPATPASPSRPAEIQVAAASIPLPPVAPAMRRIDPNVIPVAAAAIPMPKSKPDLPAPAPKVMPVALAYAAPASAPTFEDIVGISPISRINTSWSLIENPAPEAKPGLFAQMRCGLLSLAGKITGSAADETCQARRTFF